MRDTLAALIKRVERATAAQQGEVMLAVLDALNLPADLHYRIVAMIEVGAFLDAAVSLVPTKPVPNLRPGQWWWWMLEVWPGEVKASVHYENGDSGIIEESASAATPALTLIAAGLRAMMESADDC